MPFDPSQPFEVVADKPAFDPSKPFEPVATAEKPPFDPAKPFEVESSPATQQSGMGDLKAAESTMPGPPVAGMGDLKTAESEIPVRPTIPDADFTWKGQMEQFKAMREMDKFDREQGIVPEHQKPLFEIPKPERTGPVSGVIRGALNVTEAMTTEENLALLATGIGAPEVVGKVIAAAFVPMMAKGAVEGVKAGIEAPTTGEKAEKFTEAALSLGMAGLAAKHSVGRPVKGGTADIPRVGAEDIILASEKAVQEIIAPKPPLPSTESTPPTGSTAGAPTGAVGAGAEAVPSQAQATPPQPSLKPYDQLTPEQRLGVDMAQSRQPPELRPRAENIVGGKPMPDAPIMSNEELAAIKLGGTRTPQKAVVEPVVEQVPAGEPTVTSTKNAVTDAERAERGAEPLESGAHVSNETTWKQAEAELQADPKKGVNLVKELNEKARPITSVENDVLLREKIATHNRGKQLLDTINDPKTTEEVRARASEELARNDADIDAIDTALRLGGTETGRALQARQKMAAEDFTLTAMRARVRAQQGGKPLDATQEATIRDLHDKLEASQKRIAELEEKGSAEKAATTLKNLAGEGTRQKPLSGPVRSKLMERLKASHDEAVVNLRKRLGRTSAGVDPTILADVAKIGAYHIANGATKLGQFTQRMVKELGDWIKGDIKDIYKAARDEFNSARDAARDLEPADAREAVLQKVAGGKLTQKNVFDLARHHVNEGITELDAVMDAVKKDLSESHPDITTRELRDLFSGYGEVRFPSKEADLTKLRELRRLGQLASAIEDAQRKIAPKKTGGQRDQPTQAIRDKMKELKAAMEEAGIETTSPEQQLASRNQARATALRNQIEDLERRISTGQQKPKGKPVPDSAEVAALKQQRDALKREADALFPEDTEAQRIATAKAAIKRSTERLQAKIKAGDYAPTPRREPATSKELTDLRTENAKIKLEFERQREKARVAGLSVPGKIWRGIQRTRGAFVNIASSFDFSAPRQAAGAILSNITRLVTNPAQGAKMLGRPVRDMFAAWSDEKVAHRVEARLRDRPNAKNGVDKMAGVEFTELDNTKFTKAEENAHSILDEWAALPLRTGNAAKTAATLGPKLGARAVRMSNRAFITFLNVTRAELLDHLLDVNFRDRPPTPQELKAIGTMVNVATGRGSLSPKVQAVASEFIWAPKLLASRVQFLSGQPLWRGNARTRSIIAKEYARIIAGGYLLWATSRLFDEKKEGSSTSSDWGKIVRGNTRIDMWGGHQQVAVLGSRVAQAKTTTLSGKEKDIGAERSFGVSGPFAVSMNFLRTKLRPDVAEAINILDRKNVIGQKTTPESVAQGLLVPLPMRNMVELIKDRGLTEAMALQAISMFGAGISVHSDKEEKATPTR